MKKVVSLLLVFAMLLSTVCVFAAPVAEKYDATSIVNVTGKVEDGAYVNLLLIDANDDIKHVQEVKPELDGSYRAKFKFKESTDGLTLAVKQGGADVTDSVISAVTESEAFTLTFGAKTLKDSTIVSAEFKNYFNIENKTYVIMVAFYDEAGKLIKVITGDKKAIGFNESSDEVNLDIPEGCATVKAFMWDSVEKMIPLAKEKTTKPSTKLSVLTIGNSFTDDPTAYLGGLAKKEGFELNLTHAHHGGSSILNHWNNYESNTPYYNAKTVNDETVYTKTLLDHIDPALNGGKYFDMITIQQVSNNSGLIETYGFDEYEDITPETDYDNCAENLVTVLKTYQPQAEIVLQQTWSYEEDANHYAFKNYDNDQNKMFAMIEETVNIAAEKLGALVVNGETVSKDGGPLRYIPTGQAFQNARKSPIFQTKYVDGVSGTDPVVYTLHRDGYHSSHLYGRYLGALVWYGALSGNSPTMANTYEHSYKGFYVDETAKAILKQAAQDALESYGRWN